MFRRILEACRVTTVAGIASGAVLVGLGSRLAMLLLRLTSPDSVHGVTSDDGFVIGEVTLAGTYNLLQLGAAVGIIGAVTYRLVSPRLIGPLWFRRLTTGVAAAAVAGAALIHADGVDFRVLGPLWVAIALFLALPFVFGTFVGSVVDAVARPDSWTVRGRRAWIVPVVSIACFPLIAPVVIVAVVVVAVTTWLGSIGMLGRWRTAVAYVLAVRAVWLSIALAGLVALIGDIRELA